MSELNIISPATGYQTVNAEKSTDGVRQSVTSSTIQAIDDVDKIENAISSEHPDNNEKIKELTAAEISETVEEMNNFLQDMKRNLSFSVDEDLGKSVITVKDSENDEVIRQIPSEELVVLRKKMDDVAGILFDTKV